MRQKSSRSVWLLMLAPIAMLLVVGWFLRDKTGTFTPPLPQTGPLRMVVTDVKFEELKPREVAEGFDTKVTLTLDLAGQFPQRKNATLFFVPQVGKTNLSGLPKNVNWKLRDGETIALDVNEQRRDLNAPMMFTRNGEKERPQVSFLLKLSSMPTSSTRTALRCRLHGVLLWRKMLNFGTGAFPNWIPGGAMPSFPFEFMLRKPNQKTKTPQVSRARNIDIQKVTARYQASQGHSDEGVMRVDAAFRYQIESSWFNKQEPRFNFGQPYVEDARGRRYSRIKTGGGTHLLSGYGHGLDEDKSVGTANFEVRSEQIPLNAGQLTFKANLSINDAWPTPISIVIRTQAESVPAKPSPFRLIGTSKSRGADIHTKRMITSLHLEIKYNGNEKLDNGDESRIVIFAPRVVDSANRERDALRGWTLPGGDDKKKLYGVSYDYDLSKIPKSAGRLMFKAEIGMRRIQTAAGFRCHPSITQHRVLDVANAGTFSHLQVFLIRHTF